MGDFFFGYMGAAKQPILHSSFFKPWLFLLIFLVIRQENKHKMMGTTFLAIRDYIDTIKSRKYKETSSEIEIPQFTKISHFPFSSHF